MIRFRWMIFTLPYGLDIRDHPSIMSSRGATHWFGEIWWCDDTSVETGVGGQAKYDVMMVFCGNALQQHNKSLKTSTRRYSDCHINILHILLYTIYVVKKYWDDCFLSKHIIYEESPEEPHLAWGVVYFLWVTSHVSLEPLSHAIGLEFNMLVSELVGVGIDHLWSWARFMATQILIINFPNRASLQKLSPKFEMP